MASSLQNGSLELTEQHVRSTESTTSPADDFSQAPGTDIVEASRAADATVPDGGSGWIVVAACFMITWWFVGTSYSWGVIQAALVAQKLSSPSTLSFVGSLTPACIAFFALLNARVVKAIGVRTTALLGVTLLGVGGICSGFATKSVPGLFMTAGVIGGIGTSLCFMVVSVIPSQYFNKKRGLANGIVYSGGGLGGAAISFAMDALIQRLGVAWTFRLIGFLTLVTGLPAAWFVKERIPIHRTTFVDWSLFHDTGFLLLFLVGVIGTFPLFVPPFFLPIYSEAIGLTPTAGAGLVAAFNFSSAIGRIGCGLLCDHIGSLNTLFITLLLSATTMLTIWPNASSAAALAVFAIINGAANGGFFATMPTVIGNVFGSARISVVMGMIVSGWAGGYLMGAPIGGYILAAYGGAGGGLSAFRPAMFYAGSMAMGATALVGFIRLRINTKLLKKL